MRPSDHFIDLFSYEHLPENLKTVSKLLGDVAFKLMESLPEGPEKTAGLRKLMEAKDCFVRAKMLGDKDVFGANQ